MGGGRAGGSEKKWATFILSFSFVFFLPESVWLSVFVCLAICHSVCLFSPYLSGCLSASVLSLSVCIRLSLCASLSTRLFFSPLRFPHSPPRHLGTGGSSVIACNAIDGPQLRERRPPLPSLSLHLPLLSPHTRPSQTLIHAPLVPLSSPPSTTLRPRPQGETLLPTGDNKTLAGRCNMERRRSCESWEVHCCPSFSPFVSPLFFRFPSSPLSVCAWRPPQDCALR